MAIYTYLCNKCNRRFDIFQGKEPAICDVCQSEDIKRVFTAPMIRTSRQENSSSSCSSCIRTSCATCK